MEVVLRFNDNKILSELYFDGRYCNDTRLRNYMLNKPFEKWIESFHTRYVNWQGFLVELSEKFNTRNFLFSFFGESKNFEQFQRLTRQVAPEDFNISFKFTEIVAKKQDLDTAFINEIVSMLRHQDDAFARQLIQIKNLVSEINFNVIYGNIYAFRTFVKWGIDLPINVNSLEISMPIIVISDTNFHDNPYEICHLHQIEPSDTMIIVINGRQNIQLQVLQLKQHYKDIPVFSPTASDSPELVTISRLYNSYKKKAFRKFILNCPDEVWIDPQAVKSLIATL